MKLTVDFSLLKSAVDQMGAVSINRKLPKTVIKAIDPLDLSLEDGIEVTLKDVEFNTGIISLKGRQVILYIKDHSKDVTKAINNPSSGRKFHVSDCSVLKEMRQQGRFGRYVATTRLDGLFEISGRDPLTRKHIKNHPVALNVCKKCLEYLNYEGYQTGNRNSFHNFNIASFFETYSSFFPYIPQSLSLSDVGYTDDWSDVSRKTRSLVNYICNDCKVSLLSEKRLLHVHHINGVKHDNSKSNLVVLCIDCHRKQPNHDHLAVSHKEMQRITFLRNEQGILKIKTWDSLLKMSDPGMKGVIELLKYRHLPLAQTGFQLTAENNDVIALELAWPDKKVGVAVDKTEAIKASKLGWKVYSMRHALEQIDQLSLRVK